LDTKPVAVEIVRDFGWRLIATSQIPIAKSKTREHGLRITRRKKLKGEKTKRVHNQKLLKSIYVPPLSLVDCLYSIRVIGS